MSDKIYQLFKMAFNADIVLSIPYIVLVTTGLVQTLIKYIFILNFLPMDATSKSETTSRSLSICKVLT